MKSWRLFCLVCVAALAPSARAVEVLTPNDVLIVEFEIQPPFCGSVPCTPDVLQSRVGPAFVAEAFGERTSRLFVDGVLLGTWVNTDFGTYTGNLGNFNSGVWKDATSPYDVLDPAIIDFAPVLAGSTDARFELRILRGRLELQDGFPNAQLFLIVGATGQGDLNSTPVTAAHIEADTAPPHFVVDSTAPDADASPGDGFCATALGECTLPAAVEEANGLPGTNSITVPAGSYPGAVTITERVSITGAGIGVTTIDGGSAGATITVTAGDVSLEGLSITGGSNAGSGGGIDARGDELSLVQVEVFGNTAAGDGGGIAYTAGSSLFLLDSVVRDNTAGGSGGGIHFAAPSADVEILLAQLVDNDALAGDGGGLHVDSDAFTLLDAVTVRGNTAVRGGGLALRGFIAFIAESHIFANTAAEWAGGVALSQVDGIFTDSTVSGNTSTSSGVGGLFGFGDVTLEVSNSTFSGNEGQVAGGLGFESPFDVDLLNTTVTLNTGSEAGGLRLATSTGSGTARLANNLVADDESTGPGPDCRSTGAGVTLVSLGYNLIGDGTDCAFPSTAGDQVGSAGAPIDPLLGPLEVPPLLAGSGLPPVHSPLPGSPAIDAGNPAVPESAPEACVTFDQLGYPRPFDGDDDGSAVCDVGAVEFGASLVPVLGPGALALLCALLAACAAAWLGRTAGTLGRS